MAIENMLKEVNNSYNDYTDLLHATSEVILFGAGGSGLHAKRMLEGYGISIIAFCDNNPAMEGKQIDGITIVAADAIDTLANSVPILICSDWTHDIAVQLKRFYDRTFDFSFCWDYERWKPHFESEVIFSNISKIEEVVYLFKDDISQKNYLDILKYKLSFNSIYIEEAPFQCYNHPLVLPEPHDIIIDGGAWEGDTALMFSNNLNGKCTIYSFEPNLENFKSLQSTFITNNINGLAVQQGLYSGKDSLFIKEGEKSSHSSIKGSGEYEVQLTSIDAYCEENGIAPSLIKLDVEGVEIEVLKGACETIKKKPKLHISVYHNPFDIWDIPIFINKQNPSYTFYLSNHSQYLMDTVLYAL